MMLDYGIQERVNRLRRSTLRHSFDSRATNSPTIVTQRVEQRRRVVRLVIAKSLSRIQARRFIACCQTRREFALAFKSFSYVFNSDDESGNRIAVTQWRDRDALLHFIEMF